MQLDEDPMTPETAIAESITAEAAPAEAITAGAIAVGRPQLQQTVLVVDDEPMVREVLTQYLMHDGYRVVESADGEAALAAVADEQPDLMLLDLMLPKYSGLDVLRHIRITSRTPVILLTARGDEDDRVTGLELGADDYIVKPFSPREVAARVRSVLRRTATTTDAVAVVHFGDITVDVGRREVTRDGEPVELTRKEFDLLAYFVSHEGLALSRDHLLTEVWSSSTEWQDSSTVTVHLSRLRQKLEHHPNEPRHFVTIYGVGYRFER